MLVITRPFISQSVSVCLSDISFPVHVVQIFFDMIYLKLHFSSPPIIIVLSHLFLSL